VPAADQEKILDQFENSVALTANADVAGEADLQRVPSAKPKRKDQMLDVFSAETRPRLFFAVFLMGMQQLSGIDGVLYVSLHTLCLSISTISHLHITMLTIRSSTRPSFFNKPVSHPTSPDFSPPAFPHS